MVFRASFRKPLLGFGWEDARGAHVSPPRKYPLPRSAEISGIGSVFAFSDQSAPPRPKNADGHRFRSPVDLRRPSRERPYGPSAPPPAQSISSNFLTTDTSAGSQSTVSSVSFVSHFIARCSVKVISPDTTSHMKQCIVRWKVG